MASAQNVAGSLVPLLMTEPARIVQTVDVEPVRRAAW